MQSDELKRRISAGRGDALADLVLKNALLQGCKHYGEQQSQGNAPSQPALFFIMVSNLFIITG